MFLQLRKFTMKEMLYFNDTGLAITRYCGQCYLTLSEVARALYSKGGAQSDAPFEIGIRQTNTLYRRHADEFTDSMTTVIKMQTAGGMQDVRIFSLRGCHLLGMFARSERAKEFRRWVLDVLDGEVTESQAAVTEFQAALIEFTSRRAVASLCGRGLYQWKSTKTQIEARLAAASERIQPSLQF